jgi:hypothetical protein
MKIPVVYELNGRRRFLLVQDGETISIGRAAACSIQLEGDAVQEVELTAQFVNGCQFVVVHPADGSVPYAQPLPWKLTLGGIGLELLRPVKAAAGKAGREIVLQGLSAGETRLELRPDQPLLLGAGEDCAVVISDAGCPAVLLALWAAAGGKVQVQVLDDSAVVGWLGRAGETEAELPLPLSLSIGGRVLLISNVPQSGVTQLVARPMVAAAAAAVPVGPTILAKGADTGPKIISRQGKEDGGNPAPKTAAPVATGRPVVPPPTGISASEAAPLTMEEAMAPRPAPASPKAFILFSWLQVALTYAVALLPEQGIELWAAAGGTLVLTLLLGLIALIK